MKKFLYLVTMMFALTFLTDCWLFPTDNTTNSDNQKNFRRTVCEDLKVKNDSGVVTLQRCYRERQFIITYTNPSDQGRIDLHAYLLGKGFLLKKTCECSEKVELWEYPVGLSPDTDDIKIKSGGSGGNMIFNYTVTEIIDSNKTPLERLRKPEPSIQLTDKQPQSTSSSDSVLLAVEDSGVDHPANRLLSPPSMPRLSHLVNNSGASYCSNSTILEGQVGMNILRNTDGEPSSEPLDIDGHGTFIGGIVAGLSEPNGTHVGDDLNVNIKQLHVRFMRSRDNTGDLFSALCGIHYAIKKGAKIINASWRVLSKPTDEIAVKAAFYPTMNDVKAADVLLVAAAGNDRLNLDKEGKAWPAAFAKDKTINDYTGNVLSVGAWNGHPDSTRVCHFSNFGSFVDLYTVGTRVISTGLSNAVLMGEGTSYATPFVARSAAILRGLPQGKTPLTAAVIKAYIKTSADNRPRYKTSRDKILLHNHTTIVANRSSLGL